MAVKRGNQVSTEVFGVYRSKRLKMPEVGEELRVVNFATREELPGIVIGVDAEQGTYDLRFLNAGYELEE